MKFSYAKEFIKTRLFGTVLLCGAMLAFPAAQITFGQVQRTVINPSLETPAIPNTTYRIISEEAFPPWLTTQPIVANGCTVGLANCRGIEVWSSGFDNGGAVFNATGTGRQFVELNSYNFGMIYQSVCLRNGESFAYNYLHRGRASATVADVMAFRIGIPSGLPAGLKPADATGFLIQQDSTTNNGTQGAAPTGSGVIDASTAAGNGWRRYGGTYTYTGASQNVKLGFVAVSSADGNTSTGNFIDDFRINLLPFVELTSTSGSATEGTVTGGSNTPTTGPKIIIAGTLATAATITVRANGGSATLGSDYSLSVPFQAGNGTDTAVINIPAGTYDGNTTASIFAIPFSIATDNVTESNETVQFSVTGITGATIASVTSCGGTPTTAHTFTINDDDLTTAAAVSVSGRVIAKGRGVAGARVTLTDANGEKRSASTNSFGYFNFNDVSSGQTYLVETAQKSFTFAPQVLSVNDDLSDLVIEAK